MYPLIEDKRTELEELCRRFHVERLELFGSATTDRFDPETSDLDFLVEFQPLDYGKHAKSYFGLLAELEDLFDRHIDLVEIGAIQNPYLLKAIAKQRTPLYAA